MTAKAKVGGYCGTLLEQKKAAAAKPAPAKKAQVKKTPARKAEVKSRKLPKWALPAVLGVAALALVLFFVMQFPPKSQTIMDEPQQADSSAGSSSRKEILVSGEWVGEIRGVSGDFSATLELEIDQRCSYYDICGSYRALDGAGFGDLELVSINNYDYKFLEHPLQQVEELLEESGHQTMRLINDTLSWSFEQILPSGEKIESEGTFYRK